MTTPKDSDHVWKALADPTRREILDLLRDGPRQTTEIAEAFPQLSRFGVMKHLDVLREAGLVCTRSEGRRRINSLNANPLREIVERWIGKYEAYWANSMLRVKDIAEHDSKPKSKKQTSSKRKGKRA
jgi:DNA-binding transcriptional ArsR family regulator